MSNLRCTVLELVTAAATELNATEPEQIPLDRGELAPIYGKDGVLDSLGLVTFILLVEERLEDKIGRRMTYFAFFGLGIVLYAATPSLAHGSSSHTATWAPSSATSAPWSPRSS